jgi:hypothetical protein
VDLLTGEPAPVIAPKTSSFSEVLAERIADSRSLVRKPFSLASSAFRKVMSKLPTPKFKPKPAEQIGSLIYCMECGGEMKPAAMPYYPFKILLPFLALALILFGLSFRFPLLSITGVLSLACFFIYLRMRVELWQCGECGEHMERKTKKQKTGAAQGTETSST